MPIKNIEIVLRLVTHCSFRAQLGTYSAGKGTHTLAQSSVTNSTSFFFTLWSLWYLSSYSRK